MKKHEVSKSFSATLCYQSGVWSALIDSQKKGHEDQTSCPFVPFG
jgi:hypothetical protein